MVLFVLFFLWLLWWYFEWFLWTLRFRSTLLLLSEGRLLVLSFGGLTVEPELSVAWLIHPALVSHLG